MTTRALLVTLLAALAAGCADDQCDEGSARCDGTTAQNCVTGGDTWMTSEWDSTTCAVACKMLHGQATCIDSADPVDACATDGAACWNGSPTTCIEGFPTATSTCGAGTECVAAASCGALCAMPDPKHVCVNEIAADATCDGADQVECQCGLLLSRTTCAAGSSCAVDENDDTTCETNVPDARCGDPAQATSWFCSSDGAYAEECSFGAVTFIDTCTTGTKCTTDALGGASCQ